MSQADKLFQFLTIKNKHSHNFFVFNKIQKHAFSCFFFKNNENKHFQFQIMKNKRFADFLIKFKNERFACFFFKNNEKLDFQVFSVSNNEKQAL